MGLGFFSGFIHKLRQLVLIKSLIDKGNFEKSPKLPVWFLKHVAQSIHTNMYVYLSQKKEQNYKAVGFYF